MTVDHSYLIPKAVAMKVYWVQVYFIAHSHQVPVDFISHVHSEALQVPKHSSINSWENHMIFKNYFSWYFKSVTVSLTIWLLGYCMGPFWGNRSYFTTDREMNTFRSIKSHFFSNHLVPKSIILSVNLKGNETLEWGKKLIRGFCLEQNSNSHTE